MQRYKMGDMTILPQVFSDLIRLETDLWNAIDARLRAECHLLLNQFEPLQRIAQQTECRVDDIARALSITVGGTSKLVDRLEAAGYCRRRANPQDRRSSLLELTEEGEHVLAQATVVFERELQRHFGDVLDPASLTHFHMLLIRLREALHHEES